MKSLPHQSECLLQEAGLAELAEQAELEQAELEQAELEQAELAELAELAEFG